MIGGTTLVGKGKGKVDGQMGPSRGMGGKNVEMAAGK